MNGFAKRSYRAEPAAGSAVQSPIGIGRSEGAPALAYRDEDRGWWLWSPCPDCGGAELPLRDRGLVSDLLLSDASGETASDFLRICPGQDAGECTCPGCETRHRRLKHAGEDPAVWYDTLLSDWVIQLPLPDRAEVALMPLGVHWFDADWADVYRAAADVAYCADRLAEFS